MRTLDDLRNDIDRVDEVLVRLLNERARVACEIGRGLPDAGLIEMLDGVHEVVRISSPYKLASRTFKPEGTVVTVGDVRIGGDEVIVMAGPCSAENEKQVGAAAAAVRRAGAKIFRGGAFKPRSSPYSFQGLGEAGLQLLQDAAKAENM